MTDALLDVRDRAEAERYLAMHELLRLEERPAADGWVWVCIGPEGARTLRFRVSDGPGAVSAADYRARAGALLRSVPESPAGLVRAAAREAMADLDEALACLSEAERRDGVRSDRAEIEGRRERFAAALPMLSLDDLAAYPSGGRHVPADVVHRVATAAPIPLAAVLAGAIGDWRLVARLPGRVLLRLPDGGALWGAVASLPTSPSSQQASATGTEVITGFQVLDGRSALRALVEHGMRLLPEDRWRIGRALMVGASLESALERAFPPGWGACRSLVEVRHATQRVRFFHVERRGPLDREAILAVILDRAVIGWRLIEGEAAWMQRSVLEEVAPHLPGPDARGEAQGHIQQIVAALQPLLASFLDPSADRRAATAALQPRPEDYARVFRGTLVEAIRGRYEARWFRDPPEIAPSPDQRDIQVAVCTGGGFGAGGELAAGFHRGYVEIAEHLDPHRTWVAWEYRRAGVGHGRRFDGLVWVDDHWAWFPKPHRIIAELIEEGVVSA